MNLLRAYRGWMWRRLIFLLPSQAAALLVNVWLALQAPSPLPVRILCISIAMILTGVISYLVLQTLRSSRSRPRPQLQEARALRRHLKPCGPLAFTSLLLLAALMLVPNLFHGRADRRTLASLPRRSVVDPVAMPVAAPDPPGVPETVPPEKPAPLEIARGEPEIRPAIALEPAHLQLTERDFEYPRDIDVPYLPGRNATTAATPQTPEEEPLPFRPDFKELREWASSGRVVFGLLNRPLPDENDPEGWPSPEGRLEGFLLLGKGDIRVPGIALVLDIPFAQDDSVLASWTAALLPAPERADRGETPNWNHLTVAYVRRITGYTSHAQFDLSVSLGICADFFHAANGIPDPGSDPKLAPYLGADVSFWQDKTIGLLLHLGESIPVTLFGSSLGVTDFSAQIRWDLTERISLHGGYRIVLLRYRFDDVATTPGIDTLRDSLTGPIVGVDIRF